MGLFWLATLALSEPMIVFEREAAVASQIVTLDDVADLSALPPALAERARNLEIAAFSGEQKLTLPTRRVAERARAQIPALSFWLPEPDATTILVERRRATPDLREPERSRVCMRVVAALAPGAAPRASDFAAAPCDETVLDRAFRYDASARVLRAMRPLDANALVYAPPSQLLAGLRAGDPLHLTVRVGSVVVQREVVVAQAARPAENVFVRAVDNRVFAVPYPERAP